MEEPLSKVRQELYVEIIRRKDDQPLFTVFAKKDEKLVGIVGYVI